MGEPIEIGKTYGFVHVDKIADRPYRCYDCTCLKCGREFTANGNIVYKRAGAGCGDCMLEQKTRSKVDAYTGTVFGSLKVLGFSEYKKSSKNGHGRSLMVSCLCLKCGSVADLRLDRLKSGAVKECAKCARKNLKKGHEFTKTANKGGTSVLQIASRAVNKNNESGHTGVSSHKNGKWRAYITFQRKQYSLGLFTDIEDAVKARKEAEKRIYAPFLDWYAETYPESWEKIRAAKSKQNSSNSVQK